MFTHLQQITSTFRCSAVISRTLFKITLIDAIAADDVCFRSDRASFHTRRETVALLREKNNH